MDDRPYFITSPFDAIRHMDGERQFWRARELHKLLGYDRWENFEKVIAKAKVACKYNGRDVEQKRLKQGLQLPLFEDEPSRESSLSKDDKNELQ